MMPVYENFNLDPEPKYNVREDGTYKGPGFEAMIFPTGDFITELSVGMPGTDDIFRPAIYQGITPWDMQTVANMAQYGYDPLQAEVLQNSYIQAIVRAGQGLPPFWQPVDGYTGLNFTPHW